MKNFRYASYQIGEGEIGNSWVLIKHLQNGYISNGKTLCIRIKHDLIPDFDVYVSKDTPEYAKYAKLIESDDTHLIQEDIMNKYMRTLTISDLNDMLLAVKEEAEKKGRDAARYEIRKALGL